MRRRQTKTQKVARGCLEGSGPTKREALIDLNKQVDWACQYNPSHVETLFGYVIVIMPNSYGYSSMVISPNDVTENKVHSFRSFCGREPIEREIRRMRVHAAQLAWHRAEDDEAFIASAKFDDEAAAELRSWMQFQRLYDKHIKAGATPAEAHERACRGEAVKEVAA